MLYDQVRDIEEELIILKSRWANRSSRIQQLEQQVNSLQTQLTITQGRVEAYKHTASQSTNYKQILETIVNTPSHSTQVAINLYRQMKDM